MLSVFIDNIKYLLCNSAEFCKEFLELIKCLANQWIEAVKNMLIYLKQHNKESLLTIERFIIRTNLFFDLYF